MTDIFVYGTLLIPEIRHALLGKEAETTPATLHGHARKRIKDLPHAGITQQESSSVQGLLLKDISIPDTTLLDKFHEDHERGLIEVEVEGKKRIVSTYKPTVELGEEDWEPETFSYTEFFLETVIPEFYEKLKE